jgi:hypothetical protein
MDTNKMEAEVDKEEEESQQETGRDEKDAECCGQKKKIWLNLLQLPSQPPHRNAFRARA